MLINSIVNELLCLNTEKLQQLGASENLLTSINVTNNSFPKIKAYNTGLCILATNNFNYVLNLPDEYKDQFISKQILINNTDNIYLTFFNRIVCENLHCFISKNTTVKSILDKYLQYLQFIEQTKKLYEQFLTDKTQYNISAKKYNVFITKNYFFKKNTPKNSLIRVEVDG